MSSDYESDTDISNIPKHWRLPQRQNEILLPNPNYTSIQSILNTGPNGSISEERYIRMSKMLREKRFIKWDLNNFLALNSFLGARIIYVCNTDDKPNVYKYRSGGFITGIFNEATGSYIQYKAFSRSIFHIQLKNIRDLWILLPKVKRGPTDKIQLPRPDVGPSDRFVVYLDGIAIKKLRTRYDMDQFMKSQKYKRILKYGYVFV